MIELRPTLVSRLGLALLALPVALVAADTAAWAVFAIVAALYALAFVAIAKRQTIVDDTGIHARALIGQRDLAWDHIDHYTYWSGRVRALGPRQVVIDDASVIGTRHALVLYGKDGKRVRIDSRFRGAPAAIARVLDEVHTRLGERARFEPFAIADDGLHYGERVLPWPQLEKIHLDAQLPPRLRAMKAGKAFPWATCSMAHVHNGVLLLERLAERGVTIDLGMKQLVTAKLAERLQRPQLPRAEVVKR
jgi:hypothetical protein